MKISCQPISSKSPSYWLWLFRGASCYSGILVVVWQFAAPPPILVTLGAPQTVQTLHPKMGVHTRMTDEVETWKIKKNYEMVREMGAPYVVEFFPWAYIENAKGRISIGSTPTKWWTTRAHRA